MKEKIIAFAKAKPLVAAVLAVMALAVIGAVLGG